MIATATERGKPLALEKPQSRLPDGMNKTEARYAAELDWIKRENKVVDWWFASVKFRLAKRTWYTPDFLVIKRKDERIYKILIVETKGSGFAAQPEFLSRRNFIENEFLKINNEKFGYRRFDYLYLEDSARMDNNLGLFKKKIETFFMRD